MSEIPRMSISRFKRLASANMPLPVIVTADGEDVFAVVDITELAMFSPGEALAEARKVLAWLPPDLAMDT